jgi:hypothetical protein
MALAGNQGTTQAADKAIAKGKQQKKLKKLATALPKGPPPPREHKAPVVTVGHIEHVHTAKVARNRQIQKSQAQHDVTTNADLKKAQRFNAANPVKRKQSASDIYLKNPAALKAAGFKPEHEGLAQAPLRIPITLGKAAKLTAETVKEKPSTAARLPVDLGKSLLSVPAGLIRSGLHPKKAAEEIAHDYSRRYGGLYGNKPGAEKQFKERQKKEGIAPEALDLATVVGAGGASVGRGLQKVAEAGSLGKAAEKIATAERPALQVSGEAVAQKAKGKNFLKNYAKHRLDIRRAKKTTKTLEVARKKDRSVPLLQAEAARKAAEGTPTVAPLHPKLAERAQRMSVAKYKGRAIVRQKVEQQTLDRELYKRAHKVDPYAFKYATQYGIRNSKQAKEILSQHLERVKAGQAKLIEAGREIPAKQNEIPHLEQLLKNPEVFDHQLLQGAVRAGAAAARKVAQESPGVADLQAVERRLKPQAELLGIERGASSTPRLLYHGSPHGPGKITREGLRVSAPPDAASPFASRAGVYLSSSPKMARLYGRHIYEINPNAIKDLTTHPKIPKELHTPHAVPAEAIRYLGHAGEWDDRLIAGLEKDVPKKSSETQLEYLARVQREIKAAGLRPGEYYPSAKRVERQFLNRTTGGSRAMAESKGYTGALTLSGREHASLDLFTNSLHQEVRRKHNWNLVNKIFETHTVPWSRDKKLNELQDLVDKHNIDPSTVTYVDMGKIQSAKKLDEEPGFKDTHFATDPAVQGALDKAFVDPAYVAKHPDEFRNTSMAIIPREVANELRSGFKQTSLLGRGWRVAKGGASRVLLSNPVWLQFQVLSNAMMSGIHGTGLASAIKAHYKFKEPEWKALESDIGVHRFYDDRAHLGASVNNNAFIDGWRGWQKVGAGSKLRYAAHPVREFFNLFHRGDTAQNNFFRRAVLYNDVKREAYRRMANDAGRMSAVQTRIMNTLKLKDPQELMDAIIKDPHQFEQHAQAVDDFMGNWTSYTSRERQLLGNAMFGGFIRFSTRLAFYTMPMRHPIMYSIALQMGRLEKDELKQIFGSDPPPWEIGNYYSEDGKAKFQAVRLNPFANALTQLGTSGGNNLVGSLPPILAMTINQFAKENVGSSQPWYIGGKQIDVRQHVGAGPRAKMLAEALLQLSPFYRAVEKHGIPGVVKPLRGKQNTDSGVLFPSPRNPKRADTKAANEKLKKTQDESSWLDALTPFGQSGTAAIQSAQDYAKSQHKIKSKKKKGPSFDILGGPAGSHSIEILH